MYERKILSDIFPKVITNEICKYFYYDDFFIPDIDDLDSDEETDNCNCDEFIRNDDSDDDPEDIYDREYEIWANHDEHLNYHRNPRRIRKLEIIDLFTEFIYEYGIDSDD